MKDNSLNKQDNLDDNDKRLLDIIQTGFPLSPRPYAAMGEELGLTEAETLERVRALRQKGIIRRLGANFQSSALGFRSTLCAAKVPPEKFEAFVADVNSHSGATHNYLRDHEFNVWFTYIGENWELVCDALAAISARHGIAILNLPATRLYKIRVDFSMAE